TNYHFVLWYGAERTILVKHELYQYALPPIQPARWLYLSSIGSGTEKYHDEIADYLAKNPEVKFAFQPGTFQITLGTEKLRALYERAEVLFVNREEAERILTITKRTENFVSRRSPRREGEADEIFSSQSDIFKGLRALGPKIVCVTDGLKGAYMADESGAYFMPPYPDPKPPLERTGAGDAFAATFVSYLALGKTPLEALRLAPINSAYVVQDIGAQRGLLSREALEKYLASAPTNYQPRKI
ncbi:MAG: carbohydrate kinase family protein, partial [bacterium]|nr:carbohydrate kinase family protein [bacterium]